MDNQIEKIFDTQLSWNTQIPNYGHEKRFLQKLRKQKPKNKLNWLPFSIAAAIVLSIGIIYQNYDNTTIVKVKLSPQVQETEDYFSSIVKNELETLKKQETPQSKILIDDALIQMETLEADYQNLKSEIATNGENKQLIFAMITNMQTRINFIKSVLEQVESLNKLKLNSYENHI